MKLNSAILTIFIFLLNFTVAFSQSTSIQLPTSDNTSSFDILKNDTGNLFRLFGDGGFYLGGTLNSGDIPVTGAGARLMWFPTKAAFRVGEVSDFGSTYWDNSNIGYWSTAFGNNTMASGNNSFAGGFGTTASGSESFAIGNNSTASGDRSFSFNGTSSSTGSISLGSGSQSFGDDAIALGPSSISGGLASVCIGPSTASGNFGIAIGLQNSARGNLTLALGKNARAGHTGSCVIGDGSATFSSDSVYSTANNQMSMRFVGGFKLYTVLNLSVGLEVPAGGNSWSSISDSTKKENFIRADGETFLNGLSKLRLGSWNYKTQGSDYRHYGPMAQEIFRYFGKDNFGVIGNDTTIASADMDGIIMVCLQALEKRTNELGKAQEKITELEKQTSELVKAQKKIDQLEKAVNELLVKVNNMADKKEDISIKPTGETAQ